LLDMDPFVRRVITGFDGDTPVITSDGEPPNTVVLPSGLAVSELLWLEAPPAGPHVGDDLVGSTYSLEPPPGGLSSRILRLPPDDEWLRVPGDDPALPGMHATDTLDLMLVLGGQILLGLPDGERLVGPGDAVVQRGAPHRWRVVGDEPCTYWVTMLRPDPARSSDGTLGRGPADSGRRRLVTGGEGLAEDDAPLGLQVGGTTIVDLWQTGGPLASPLQGGDAPAPWQLEPVGRGVSFRWLELAPVDHGEAGWHETATIDVDVILAGRVALELPGGIRAELGAGDVVVQRGTDHRWVVLGGEPLQMATVMVAFA
jgi:hypothetical protein